MKNLLDAALSHLPAPFTQAHSVAVGLGESGCLVFRLHSSSATAMLKISSEELMPDYLRLAHPNSDQAEYLFYTELWPSLRTPAPAVMASGWIDAKTNFLLLEDVHPTHFFPSLNHRWTTTELMSVLEIYGSLHGRATTKLQGNATMTLLKQDPRLDFCATAVLQALQQLSQNSWTQTMARPVLHHRLLEHALELVPAALEGLPCTLLHNDFYPLNIALPSRDTGQTLLLDYQLIGSGPALLDIQNIGFLHNRPAFTGVDKEAALRHYLHHLNAASEVSLTPAEFWHTYPFAVILGWSDYLPRFVRAMTRHNSGAEPWNKWLDNTLKSAMLDWERALDAIC